MQLERVKVVRTFYFINLVKIKDFIWVVSGVISETESVAYVSGVWKKMGREFRPLEKRERRASGVYGLFRYSHRPERCKNNYLILINDTLIQLVEVNIMLLGTSYWW